MMLFDKRQIIGPMWEQRGLWRKPWNVTAHSIRLESSHGYELMLEPYDIAVLRDAIVLYDGLHEVPND